MEITKGIIADIIGFIKSFIEAVQTIMGSVVTKNNYEGTDYYPDHY